MRLVVGLGNPGPKYRNNRHNIGFMAADEIVRRHGLPAPRARFQGEISEGAIAGERVCVLKPMTYMNESGRSVGEALRFFKLSPADVIVIHDEIDLAAAKVRVKRGGGHAGHNGLRSIESHLGTRDFCRVRLGVGHPGEKERVHGHVLGNFSKEDEAWLRRELEAIAGELPLLFAGRDSDFMSRVTMAMQDRPAKKKRPAEGTGETDAPPAADGDTPGAGAGEAPRTGLADAFSRAFSRLKGQD